MLAQELFHLGGELLGVGDGTTTRRVPAEHDAAILGVFGVDPSLELAHVGAHLVVVADRVVETLAPIWEARSTLVKNPSRIDDIVQEGSRKAGIVAKATLGEVTEAMKI